MLKQLEPFTCHFYAQELHQKLAGVRIAKIQQPTNLEFVFTLFFAHGKQSQPETAKEISSTRPRFFISLNPEQPFCALLPASLLNNRFSQLKDQTRERPTGFCMALRKHLNNATIQRIDALEGEAVINIQLDSLNELGHPVSLCLSLELMGKHTNMLLVDVAENRLLAVAHCVEDWMSRERPLSVGDSYRPPPKPAEKYRLSQVSMALLQKELPNTASCWSAAEWTPWLKTHLWGLKPVLLEAILNAYLSFPTTLAEILSALNQLQQGRLPRHLRLCQSPFSFTWVPENTEKEMSQTGSADVWVCQLTASPAKSTVFPFCDLLSQYFWKALSDRELQRHWEQLNLPLARQLQKIALQIKEILSVQTQPAETLTLIGNALLLAHSHQHGQGEAFPTQLRTRLEIPYGSGHWQQVAVLLHKTWLQNSQQYYRLARKTREKARQDKRRLEKLEDQLAFLQTLQVFLEEAHARQSLTDIQALREDWIRLGLLKAPDKGSTKRPSKPGKRLGHPRRKTEPKPLSMTGILELVSSSGIAIWVGKTGAANALLCGKLATGNDWWLHLYNQPGAHVLIKCGKQPVDEATLTEAAMLAAYFSKAQHNAYADVVVTQARHVRKIPGSYPGHVTYQQEQIRRITLDTAKIRQRIEPYEK